MMNHEQKDEVVNDLREKINKAEGIFLTNLVGLVAEVSTKVRKNIRENNGSVVITRNTLMARAAKGTKAESLFSNLKGPNAIAFAFNDPAAVAKILFNLRKDHEVARLGAGLLGDKPLKVAEVEFLANLPSRDLMLGTLLATFNAPVSAFARVVEAVRAKKEAEQNA